MNTSGPKWYDFLSSFSLKGFRFLPFSSEIGYVVLSGLASRICL